MKLLKKLKFILASLLVLVALSCNNSNDSNSGPASISVKLVDAPGDYENVFIEVVDVMVKYDNDDDTDDESGWESLGIIAPGTYDLLELTAGVSLELVDNEEIEAGTIKQIRLVLGDNNSVVLEGETMSRPLTTPSAQQSGLKVMVNQDIQPGFNYDFILDFDADASIVNAGNSGNIILKPVLRASLEVNSGTLSGIVLPAETIVEITASNGTIEASTLSNNLGEYEIAGLPSGVYTITMTPEESSELEVTTLTEVTILAGEITVLETVTLE